jgi:hypothetical protein
MLHIVTSDLALRLVVTALFGVGIATYAYALVAQRRRWTSTVNHLLHVAMSLAMILMAWRAGIDFPTFGPVAFFALAGVWFVYLAGRASRDRMINSYYAVTMAAMAWMYAVMGGSPGGSMASGIDMPAHPMPSTPAEPAWITAVNWIVTLAFAIVALYWPCRYFAERRTNPEPIYQAFTAAGTALMFGALL